MAMKVTDLEKFALEEVWRPFQSRMGFDRRLVALPVNLEKTAKLLIADETGWSELVLDRISRIGVWFPSYINHPLVDAVRAAQTAHAALQERE